MCWYIVYWQVDYKSSINALASKAVRARVRYVVVTKPFLLPGDLQQYGAGQQIPNHLLAVAYSEVDYSQEEWDRVFECTTLVIEKMYISGTYDDSLMKWMDSHVSRFSRKVVGGIKRVRVEDEDMRKRRKLVEEERERRHEIERNFVVEMRETTRDTGKLIFDNCCHRIALILALDLADYQDTLLLSRRDMCNRWSKLEYYRTNHALSEEGLAEYRGILKTFSRLYRDYERYVDVCFDKYGVDCCDMIEGKVSEFCKREVWDRTWVGYIPVEYSDLRDEVEAKIGLYLKNVASLVVSPNRKYVFMPADEKEFVDSLLSKIKPWSPKDK